MFSWIGAFRMGNENAALVRYLSDSLNPIAGNSICKYRLVTFLIERKTTNGIVVNKIVEGDGNMSINPQFIDSGDNPHSLKSSSPACTLLATSASCQLLKLLALIVSISRRTSSP